MPTPAGPVSLIGAKILATYPLPTGANWGLLSTPGQLWVAVFGVGGGASIDVRSPVDASLIANIPLARGNRQVVRGMAFDGHLVWAITADLSSGDGFSGMTVQLVAIDAATHQIVHTVKLPKIYPLAVDYGAGTVFVGAQCYWFAINPTTAKVIYTDHEPLCPGFPAFAGGGGNVWDAGAFLGTAILDSSTFKLAERLNVNATLITPGGPRMWMIGAHYSAPLDTHPAELFGFNLEHPTVKTSPTIRLETEYGVKEVIIPDFMVYDGASIWLGAGLDRFVSQHDGVTGHVLQRIAIETAAELAAGTNLPKGLAYDGHDLWALTAQSLIRIGAP